MGETFTYSTDTTSNISWEITSIDGKSYNVMVSPRVWRTINTWDYQEPYREVYIGELK